MKTRVFQFDRHGDFSELTLRDQVLPEPQKGQALVRMRAVGLNNSEARYVGGRYAPPPFSPPASAAKGWAKSWRWAPWMRRSRRRPRRLYA